MSKDFLNRKPDYHATAAHCYANKIDKNKW